MATTRLEHQLIRSHYPCHAEHTVQLQAIEPIPRERYVRSCPECGRTWDIIRTTISTGNVRLDKLEWEGRNNGYGR